MTNQEAINYLQQLYPNGGHCWLDEQRIEAIGMAVKALREEPVSEDLEEAAEKYAYELFPSVGVANTETELSFKAGAKWKEKKDQEVIETAIHHAYHNGRLEMKEKMTAEAIDGIARPDDNEIWCNLSTFNFKDGDKCKVILIKEN